MVDVVIGGFPCQPFSVAGNQLGADDPRNMWPSTADVVSVVRPRFCMFENVPGIREYLPVVVRDLRRLGYNVQRPLRLGADDCGHIHRRKRVWIHATNSGSQRRGTKYGCQRQNEAKPVTNTEVVERGWKPELLGIGASVAADIANGDSKWQRQLQRGQSNQRGRTDDEGETSDDSDSGSERRERDWTQTVCVQSRLPWSQVLRSIKDLQGRPDIPEPLLWGMDARLADRLDRTRAIGNGQVPIVAATAWNILTETSPMPREER
jgi:DNA (cytosine-5)-methyltransferase 1